MHSSGFFKSALIGALVLLQLPQMAVAQTTQSIAMVSMDSGAFYIKATVARMVVTDMLLDTGSGYVSLSAQTFEGIRDAPGTVFQRYITGVLADGKMKRVPVYQISELKLSKECVLHDLEVAVMHSAKRDILGLSALRQLQPLTLQMDPPMLTANCVHRPLGNMNL